MNKLPAGWSAVTALFTALWTAEAATNETPLFVYPGTADDQSWSAAWVGVATPPTSNQWTAFRKTFVLDKRPPRSSDQKGATDDRANALAVVAGLAKPEQFPALLEVFRRQKHTSPYMQNMADHVALLLRWR
jgi:hypothetical protein